MENAIRSRSRPVTTLQRLAGLFGSADDPRRLRILAALLSKELCVCELVDVLAMPQYEVSRHLGVLRNAGLLTDRREGLWVYYSIPIDAWRDPLINGFLRLIEERMVDDFQVKGDRVRLRKRLALRDGDRCVVGSSR